MAVNCLGQLALLSTGIQDFDLVQPVSGFQKLRWTMFKPNLLQISNSGYMAFKEAHVKMDVIRQDTERIPNGMKEIVLILVKGDKATLETALPIALRNIEDIAQNCLQCAEVNFYYNLDK